MTLYSLGLDLAGFVCDHVVGVVNLIMAHFYDVVVVVVSQLPTIAPLLGASVTFLTDRTNRLIMDFVLFTIHLFRFMRPIVKYAYRYYLSKLVFAASMVLLALYRVVYIGYLWIASRVFVQRYQGAKIPSLCSILEEIKLRYRTRVEQEARRLKDEDAMMAQYRSSRVAGPDVMQDEVAMHNLATNPNFIRAIREQLRKQGV